MRFGKKNESELWTLEAGFGSAWKQVSTSDSSYVLTGCSGETYGLLNMTLTIDRKTGKATCKAEWNSPEMRRNEPKPAPVKLNAVLVIRKGREKRRLNY
jgi:hypothetical protein